MRCARFRQDNSLLVQKKISCYTLRMDKKLYSTKEIAERFQVDPVSVGNWIKMGLITAQKIGKIYVIAEDSLEGLESRLPRRGRKRLPPEISNLPEWALKKLTCAFYGMWQRCTVPRNESYERYGGRGIQVCERWKDLVLFIKDMGCPPTPNHSIDRIDVNGNYDPDNCRWATDKEQRANKRPSTQKSRTRAEIPSDHWENKQSFTTGDVAEAFKVPIYVVRDWIKAGRLQATKVGRDHIIEASALRRFTPPQRGRPKKQSA